VVDGNGNISYGDNLSFKMDKTGDIPAYAQGAADVMWIFIGMYKKRAKRIADAFSGLQHDKSDKYNWNKGNDRDISGISY
jgi:hypothetical protein